MTGWRSKVSSEAEQVVEHFGISAHNVEAVDALRTDELFQELALAHHAADLARDVTVGIDADDSEELLAEDVSDVEGDLLGLLRDRGASRLIQAGFERELAEADR